MREGVYRSGGFTGRFVVLENALVTPEIYDRATGTWNGGLRPPADAPEWAHHMRMGRLARTGPGPVADAGPTTEHLPGTHIYGGVRHFHFGHFTAEHLHRLWITESSEFAGCPVVFADQEHAQTKRAFVDGWMDVLGIRQFAVLAKPVRVERLVVAEQAKQWFEPAKPGYQEFLERRVGHLRSATPRHPGKLVVLRPHLHAGRIMGEAWLENELARQGYVVFRPEEHSVRAQLEHYLDAKKIIFSEGSAIHTFDVMPRTDADIAVINRRKPSVLASTSLEGKCRTLHIHEDVNVIGHFRPGSNANNGGLSIVRTRDVTDFLFSHGYIEKKTESDFLDDRQGVMRDVCAYVEHFLNRRTADGKRAADQQVFRAAINLLARGLADQIGRSPDPVAPQRVGRRPVERPARPVRGRRPG